MQYAPLDIWEFFVLSELLGIYIYYSFFWQHVSKLKLFLETSHLHPTQEPILTKSHTKILEQLKEFLTSPNKNLIAVLGPWGTGKSTTINMAIKNLASKDKHCVKHISFYGVESPLQGTLKLLSGTSRFFAFVTFVLLAFSFKFVVQHYFKEPNDDYFFIIFPIGLSFILYTNRQRVFYGIVKTIQNIIPNKKSKIIILEDIDRSQMEEKEWWTLLSSLWDDQYTKYIVPLGYTEIYTDEGKVCETLSNYKNQLEKLGFSIVYHPSLVELNDELLKQDTECLLPYNKGFWLADFTAREILAYLEMLRTERKLLKEKYPNLYSSKLFQKIIASVTFTELYQEKLAENPHETPALRFSKGILPRGTHQFSSAKYTGIRKFIEGLKDTGFIDELEKWYKKNGMAKSEDNWLDINLQKLFNEGMRDHQFPEKPP